MRKVIPFLHPMRGDVFERHVKDRAKFSAMVLLTEHIRDRMQERDISLRQVFNTLRNGTLLSGPEWNEEKASYEGVMQYYGTGRDIRVVVAIRQSELTVVAVTAY